jgi:hypothetical protein
MNIDEWLSTHEAISLHWIENKLGLSKGTIRKGRTIPERYIKDIEAILIDYGYDPHKVIQTKTISNDFKQYTIVKSIIKEKRIDTGWLVPSNDFPDNSLVIIELVK